MALPLGQPERQDLEFKGRDVLKKPESIGREVVAMLNTEGGGEVWVGLAEHAGVAAVVEPIEEVESVCRALFDHLVDTLEPAPLPKEVKVQPYPIEGKGAVIRIAVRPDATRHPYAQLRSTGRHYVVRVGDRLRPMSREEIGNAFRDQAERRDGVQAAVDLLIKERTEQQGSGLDGLWMRIEPVAEIPLDLSLPGLEVLFRDPMQTCNRALGWTFVNAYEHLRIGQGKRMLGKREGQTYTEVRETGGLLFTAALERLHWKGEEKELWPYPLLEYPTSVFRLASKLYSDYAETTGTVATPLVADLALLGIRTWKLRPGTPQTIGFQVGGAAVFDEDDFVLTEPLLFDRSDVEKHPDRCAFRLVRRAYEAFGHPEDAMPREYDRQSGRLVFPE